MKEPYRYEFKEFESGYELVTCDACGITLPEFEYQTACPICSLYKVLELHQKKIRKLKKEIKKLRRGKR